MKQDILSKIQVELKAPKGQFNKFGKYKYRSCEDILEGVKPMLDKYNCSLRLTDEIVLIGERYYVKATATLTGSEFEFSSTGYAREALSKKGMDESQITGATSSYARKYALNALLCIDDTRDSDATNDHSSKPVQNSLKDFKFKYLPKLGGCTLSSLSSADKNDILDYYEAQAKSGTQIPSDIVGELKIVRSSLS